MVKKISSCLKFRLILWKNFIILRIHKCELLFEILVPFFFAIWFLIFRLDTPVEKKPVTHFKAFPLDDLQSKQFYNVAYSPKNICLEKIIKTTMDLVWSIPSDPENFTNARQLENYIKSQEFNIIGVEFDESYRDIKKLPIKVAFKMRFPGDLDLGGDWNTSRLYPKEPISGPRDPPSDDGVLPLGYFSEGFIQFQHAISSVWLFNIVDLNASALPNFNMRRLPYAPYKDDSFYTKVNGDNLADFLVFSFMPFCMHVTRHVAEEKEKQLKEILKSMGISNWIHWLAWFVRSFVLISVTIIVLILIYMIPISDGAAIFSNSDWSIIFLFYVEYGIALITFCFMMSVFFKKAAAASAVSGLLYYNTYLFVYYISNNYEDISTAVKSILCFDFNIAMYFGIRNIYLREGNNEGALWSNFFEAVNEKEDLSLGFTMMMMLVDAVIYMLICLYFEQILPGEFGVPKKWYFLCRPKGNSNYRDQREQGGKERSNPQAFEEEPSNKQIGVKIEGLKKQFGSKWVVKGVSLNMYENEITVLLGHNGAGKTTTISMMTGMIPPTAGTAKIRGYDLLHDRENARLSLGICPQVNVLFDGMSVADHLKFFSKLKGVRGIAVKSEVNRYLQSMQLTKKANVLSKNLSGGMKRKLTLCNALCGDTKVVFCDEPSSGVDPASRRQLWNLMQAEKMGRTMLLTTHFMDEADVLGDRIAIMCGGEIKCNGSSFFLKKKFGSGYRLICVKKETCIVQKVTELLGEFIPDIQLQSEIGTELTYGLPDQYSKIFGSIFTQLEENMNSLGLSGFGIGVTSLEDVFMKVGAENTNTDGDRRSSGGADKNPERDGKTDESPPDSDASYRTARNTLRPSTNATPTERESGTSSKRASTIHFEYMTEDEAEKPRQEPEIKEIAVLKSYEFMKEKPLEGSRCNQWHAMLYKKAKFTWRNRALVFLQISLGITYVILAALCSQNRGVKDLPPLTFNIKEYPRTVTLIEQLPEELTNPATKSITKSLKDIFRNLGGNHRVELFEGTNKSQIESKILEISRNDQGRVNKEYLVAYTITNDEITIWYNNQPYHVAPLALNIIHNAIAKAFLGEEASVTVTNHPAPFTNTSRLWRTMTLDNSFFITTFFIGFAMVFITALFAIPIIKEKSTGNKLLQLISGVRFWNYWLSHYLWDLILLTFTITLMFLVLYLFEISGYSSFEHLIKLFYFTLLFSVFIIPLTYLISGLFTDPASGFSIILIVYFFTGNGLLFIYFLLNSFSEDSASFMHTIFVISPHFAFVNGWFQLSENIRTKSNCQSKLFLSIPAKTRCVYAPDCCNPKEYLDWDQPGIKREVVAISVVGIIMIFLLFMNESAVNCSKCCSTSHNWHHYEKSEDLDDDVAAEQNRVQRMTKKERSEHFLVLDKLAKYYKKFVAVNYLSLAIKGKECFGLLGVNGAGKTTTFRMLTGDVSITFGNVYVRGTSLRVNKLEVYRKIGYCPQFDALLEDLTGRETMFIFCLLRGIPSNKIDSTTEELAEALGFLKHLDKRSATYSGGNKRKLSTAIALVGAPSVIYLDEPTAGLDPAARRQLWDIICLVRDNGKAIVLTSHSMDECEALCTRLVIMVNGEFKCLGSTQHLKNKFSKGVVLKIQTMRILDIRSTDQRPRASLMMRMNMYRLKEAILNKYSEAVIQSEYQNLLTVYIPLAVIKWSEIFDWVEKNRMGLNIEDYSISQTSLEEIFLDFAKIQNSDNRVTSASSCC